MKYKIETPPGWEIEVFVPVAVAIVTATLTLLAQAFPDLSEFLAQFDPTVTATALLTILGGVVALVYARVNRTGDTIVDVEEVEE